MMGTGGASAPVVRCRARAVAPRLIGDGRRMLLCRGDRTLDIPNGRKGRSGADSAGRADHLVGASPRRDRLYGGRDIRRPAGLLGPERRARENPPADRDRARGGVPGDLAPNPTANEAGAGGDARCAGGRANCRGFGAKRGRRALGGDRLDAHRKHVDPGRARDLDRGHAPRLPVQPSVGAPVCDVGAESREPARAVDRYDGVGVTSCVHHVSPFERAAEHLLKSVASDAAFDRHLEGLASVRHGLLIRGSLGSSPSRGCDPDNKQRQPSPNCLQNWGALTGTHEDNWEHRVRMQPTVLIGETTNWRASSATYVCSGLGVRFPCATAINLLIL